MSNGKTHEKVNIMYLVAIVTIVLSFFAWDWKATLVMVAGYVVGTYWMNPDLDIRSKPYNNWLFLKFIWRPYWKLGHRSIWTHGYVIGDVIRYLYLFLWFLLVSYLMTFFTPLTVEGNVAWLKAILIQNQHYLWIFFIGNALSSAAHIFQDHLSSAFKRGTKLFARR